MEKGSSTREQNEDISSFKHDVADAPKLALRIPLHCQDGGIESGTEAKAADGLAHQLRLGLHGSLQAKSTLSMTD